MKHQQPNSPSVEQLHKQIATLQHELDQAQGFYEKKEIQVQLDQAKRQLLKELTNER